MGIKLFLHAVRLVLDNYRDAIRISAILYIVPVLLASLVIATVDPRSPSISLLGFLVSIVYFAASLSVAVAWHRFILLEDRPAGLLPDLNGRRVLAYLGYLLLLGLIVIPIILGTLALSAPFSFVGGPVISFLPVIIGIFVALTVGYRLGLILPASSVDRRLRLREAWEATRGASWDIMILAFVSAVAAVLIDLPVLLFTGPLEILRLVWQVVTGWLVLLVGISILTTLYGHYVEGRPIGGSSPRPARTTSEPDFS